MTTTTTAANNTASAAATLKQAEPFMLKKRIGSTEYLVTVRYCQSGKEGLEQKLLRLIESEVRKFA